jgi:hypothetical protein
MAKINKTKNSLKAFKVIGTEDKDFNKLQDNIDQVLTPVLNCPLIDGVLVKDLCLQAGVSNEISHKLDRKPLGWMIVRKRRDSRIWDLQDTNAQPTKTLSIACSHDVQIDIWIF